MVETCNTPVQARLVSQGKHHQHLSSKSVPMRVGVSMGS